MQSKVETLLNSVTLGQDWLEVTLQDQTDTYYIMAIKDTETQLEDGIDVNSITQLILDIGIDSGLADSENKVRPLTIRRLILDFTNQDNPYKNDLNSISAYLKIQDMPYTFYLKPISFNTITKNNIDEGKSSIIVNILGIE